MRRPQSTSPRPRTRARQGHQPALTLWPQPLPQQLRDIDHVAEVFGRTAEERRVREEIEKGKGKGSGKANKGGRESSGKGKFKGHSYLLPVSTEHRTVVHRCPVCSHNIILALQLESMVDFSGMPVHPATHDTRRDASDDDAEL